MKSHRIALAALCLALAPTSLLAQQTPQGQTPPGTDMGRQRPNPTAIPEKFGPSIDAKKPIPPEEQTGQSSNGKQAPPDGGPDRPQAMGEPPARPAQRQ